MPLLQGIPVNIASDIEDFALSYPQPDRKPWASRVVPEDRRFMVRVWNRNDKNGHQCWVRFDIKESMVDEMPGEMVESSSVNATSCNNAHISGRVREHVLRMLAQRYR